MHRGICLVVLVLIIIGLYLIPWVHVTGQEACSEGESRPCGSNIGECVSGLRTCVGGEWGECLGGMEPVDEICNGLDDNCNAEIDDGTPCPEGHVCTESLCIVLAECAENETRECGSNIGICEAGLRACSEGAWGECLGGIEPVDEICNGIDDNCNGEVDEICEYVGAGVELHIIYPENITYEQHVSELNYVVSGENMTCMYILNGHDNISIACGENVTGISSVEGVNIWEIYASNINGSVLDSVIFTVDTISDDESTLSLNLTPSNSVIYGTETEVLCSYLEGIIPQLYRDHVLVSNPDLQQLAAGEYLYTCNNTDTENYTSIEISESLHIDKLSTSIGLLLNGTDGNITLSPGESVNMTVDLGLSEDVLIYVDGNLIDSGMSPLESTSTFDVGIHNVTAIYDGDENHTTSHETHWIIVEEKYIICNLDVEPDIEIIYGTGLNATCSCDEAQGVLWRNHVNVGGESGVLVNLSAGEYDFICNVTGEGYYIVTPDTATVTINKADNPVALYINNLLNQNVTTTYDEPMGVMGIAAGGVELYRNGVILPKNHEFGNKELAAGTYKYDVYARGNENYTENNTGLTYYLTINKVPVDITLLMNSNQGDSLVETNDDVSFDVSLGVPGKVVTLYTTLSDWTNQSGSSPLNYTKTITEEGYFLVMASFSGDENYTGDVEYYFINVTTGGIQITLYNIKNPNITNTTSLVTWNTLEPASSKVLYEYVGQGSISMKSDSELVTSHSILLDELLPATKYFFVVSSCDSTNLSCNTSADLSFTTLNTTICKEIWECSGWSENTCGTRNCTEINNCGTEKDMPSESLNCNAQKPSADENVVTGPVQPSLSATRVLFLNAGTTIQEDTNLQQASKKILGITDMQTEYIDSLVDISHTIVNDFYAVKHLTTSDTESRLVTSFEYVGDKKLNNFIVYDTISKAFATSAQDITVYAPDADTHEIVKDDPEFVFVYNEVLPGDQIIISYTTGHLVNIESINDSVTEVYAESTDIVPVCNNNDACEFGLGENLITCPADCESAGSCIPGELRCLDNLLQVCDLEGLTWSTVEECTWGCANNGCNRKQGDDNSIIILIIIVVIVIAIAVFNVYNFKVRKKTGKIPKPVGKIMKLMEKTTKKDAPKYNKMTREQKEELARKRLEEKVKKRIEEKDMNKGKEPEKKS